LFARRSLSGPSESWSPRRATSVSESSPRGRRSAVDDVIFDYAKGLTDGLAPARAEDAESELAQKDVTAVGIGRASILDWALKDHYTASDVTRYRETLLLAARLGQNEIPPLTVGNMREDFVAKMARDEALRRRKLDNRVEWMIMTALETSAIAYNDGRIKFAVPFGRPLNQTDQAPAGGTWNLNTSDPIGDILAVQEYMWDMYSVRIRRAIASRKVLNSILNSDRFAARSGMVGGTGALPVDPNYLINGWGPQAAIEVVQRQTNLQFIEYDSVYRTRPSARTRSPTTGSSPTTRSTSSRTRGPQPSSGGGDAGLRQDAHLPAPRGQLAARLLRVGAGHGPDPWGVDMGTGVKAFPVFPHMDLTYTMTAEAAVQKAEAEKLARAPQIGRGGFTVNATHPSERRQPAADYIEKNRAAMDKAAGTKR
jgi:hypothetical protein